VLDRAVRALARRDLSAESLRAKLARAGVSEEAQNDALEALERAGYVDDARFARARAEQLAGRGYGDEWIRADLDGQGVATELATDAIAGLEPEAERAPGEWAKLRGGLAAARTMARRGFAEETLEALLAQDPSAGVG
jgi:regulatory protein